MNLNDYGTTRDFELNCNSADGNTLVVCIRLDEGATMEQGQYDNIISDIKLGSTVSVSAGGNDYTGEVAGFITDDTWGFQVRILIGE